MTAVTPAQPEQNAGVEPHDVYVNCCVRAYADPDSQIGPYCVEIHGTIMAMVDAGDEAEAQEVGEVNAMLFKLGRALNDGEPASDILDAHSQDAADLSVLLDRDGRVIDLDTCESCEVGYAPDLLYVDRMVIDPTHRRRGIGLQALRALCATFANGDTLIALKPFPIQDPDNFEPKAVIARGQKKLAAYWSRAGFKRFRRSPFYILGGPKVRWGDAS